MAVREAQEVVRYSRRLVLGLLAAGAGTGGEALAQAVRAAAVGAAPPAARIPPGALQNIAVQPQQNPPQQAPIAVESIILLPIIRPDDLLVLNVVLSNLTVSKGPGPRQITIINPSKPGILVAGHQPQSIFEQGWQEPANLNSNLDPAPPSVAGSRMAGPSYVAYSAPPGFTSLPFTLKDILNALQTWPMRLDVNAQPVPADPLNLVGSLHSLDAVKAQLQGAAATLKGQLGVNHSKAVVQSLTRAAAKLSATMSEVSRQGRTMTQADLKSAVSSAVNASFGPKAANPSQRLLASGYVEAQAGVGVINNLGLAPTAPHQPDPDVTQLEIPYQLIQTPLATAGWTHANDVVTHGQHTEIWHSRLGTNVQGSVLELDGEPVRAIWTPGYGIFYVNPPKLTPNWPSAAMQTSDRFDIVTLTANWQKKTKTGSTYVPQPSLAKRLMLSAMGGSLDLDGHWPVRPDPVILEAWNHKAATGRDYYVRLVYAGWLFPFGHAASYVQVTERKFGNQAGGGREAVMLQRQFLIIREHSKTYPGPGQAYEARDFPFQTVEILNKVTPNLIKPMSGEPGMAAGYYTDPTRYFQGFWPLELATGQDFKFHLVGTDGAGRKIPFEMPLFFLTDDKNNSEYVPDIVTFYGKASSARTTPAMNGAKIQLAPQSVGGNAKGDTNFPVTNITFAGAQPSGAAPVTAPQFYPALAQAQVSIPSVKAMLGANTTPTVSFSKIYKQNGFLGPNKGQVFLDIASPAKLGGDPSQPPTTFGGLISPSLLPSAMSRSFGAVQGAATAAQGAAAQFAQGTFNPTDFIPDDVKLLGAVPLKKVLNTVTDLANAAGAVPQLTNIELPDQIQATYTLTQGNLQAVDPLFQPDPSGQLTINAQIIAKRDGSPPVASVDAKLTVFKVSLFGFFILNFDSLELKAGTGQKTDVTPALNAENGVLFGGPLEFVNGLRDIIPMNGFSDPPDLSVTPLGITASYSLSLPTIGVGVLSLSNVSLGAGFDLPFTGDPPSARFNFAERQSPFNLTVSLFGGGGFFAITVGTDGVQEVEASLEFGAQISIDLGVASGGVYVKGGFYFHWIGATSEVDFTGYVELGGHLSILGIISVSLVFHLELGYQKLPPSSQLYGEASLTVEVTVLFFSFGVDVQVEKQFAGSKSDPAFIDFAPNQGVWATYCNAFA